MRYSILFYVFLRLYEKKKKKQSGGRKILLARLYEAAAAPPQAHSHWTTQHHLGSIFLFGMSAST